MPNTSGTEYDVTPYVAAFGNYPWQFLGLAEKGSTIGWDNIPVFPMDITVLTQVEWPSVGESNQAPLKLEVLKSDQDGVYILGAGVDVQGREQEFTNAHGALLGEKLIELIGPHGWIPTSDVRVEATDDFIMARFSVKRSAS